MKKKLFALCLALAMLLTGTLPLVALADEDPPPITTVRYYTPDVDEYDWFTAGGVTPIDSGSSIAGLFVATGTLDSLEFYCPNWGSADSHMSIALYEWNSDYNTTLDFAPMAFRDIPHYPQAWHRLETPGFEPGAYLWVINSHSSNVGIWHRSAASPNVTIFADGVPSDGAAYVFKANYLTDPYPLAAPPYTLSDFLNSPIKGATPPVPYPADHPIYTLDAKPGTYVGTDGLGRVIPTSDSMKYTNHLGIEVDYSLLNRPEKKRDVGVFYWTWHYNFANLNPLNITQTMRQYPDLNKNDYNDPRWEPFGPGAGYQNFWDEPLFGYYNGAIDNWVLRKHAELLADAGVDVMIFDCTNGTYTWRAAYRNVMEVFTQARADGVNTPQVAFLLPFSGGADANTQLKLLYLDIYREGKYQDLWYYWNGKPLIMAYPNGLGNDQISNEIKNFFTYRPGNPLYYNGSTNSSAGSSGSGVPAYPLWDWASMYPQRVSGNAHHTNNRTLVQGTAGNREEMSVTVAQNWTSNSTVSGSNPGGQRPHGGLTAMNGNNVLGRSTYRTAESLAQNTALNPNLYQKDARGIEYGANFAQQFDYAIRMDPDFIFITGWNEWIMGRYDNWPGTSYLDGTLNVTNAFPDQYNEEFSRDIEPSKNSTLKDHYYYQMVSYIRLYKGVDPVPVASKKNNIDISGDTSQWDAVGPIFRSYQNNIGSRDAAGFSGYYYTNYTGRNDIVEAKAAHYDDNVYFMVKAKDALSPYTDPNWMRLLISTDGINGENWEGYQYILNRVSPSADKALLEISTGGWNWSAVGEVSYKVIDNILTVEIPKEFLGISGDSFTLDFKWTDNTLDDSGQNDILDFYEYGDTAPGGRFNYRYIAEFDGITVDSIEVTPAEAQLNMKDVFKFDAFVNGSNSPTQKVTWTVEGGVSGTSISQNGVLTIAAYETAVELTVKATSQQETYTHIAGTATVTVIPIVIGADPSAYITVKPGANNDLTITITEQLSNGNTNEITKTFSIKNNAAAVYALGDYSVYVDTKGNDQIRDCKIVESGWEPDPDPGTEPKGPSLKSGTIFNFNKDERKDIILDIDWGAGVLAASDVSSVRYGSLALVYGADYTVDEDALVISKDYLFAQVLGTNTLTVAFDDWEKTQESVEICVYFDTQTWLSTLQGWTRFYPMVDPNVPITTSPKYTDFMDFLTDTSGELWGNTIADTDVISIFADVLGGAADITDDQMDAFCEMLTNNNVKIATEMYGFQWCDLNSGDNPTEADWRAEAASWFNIRYRYLFTRLAERGIGIEYVDLDGTINRIMKTNPGPAGNKAELAYNHVTREDAVQLIAYFMQAIQDFYNESYIVENIGKVHDVKFNYIVNFPNHGWRAGGVPGGALQNAITSTSNQGFSNAFDDMIALANAIRENRAPMLGFIIDAPYNYYSTAASGSNTLTRMLEYERYARSLGFTFTVIFNDETGLGNPSEAKNKDYYEKTLRAIRAYEAAGGHPEIYFVESWYEGAPEVCVPETAPYSLTYLMCDVIRHIKYGWEIITLTSTAKSPAMTWKWPGSGSLSGSSNTNGTGNGGSNWNTFNANSGVNAPPNSTNAIYEIMCTDSNAYIGISNMASIQTHTYSLIMRAYLSTMAPTADTLHIRIKNDTEHTNGKFSFMKSNVWYDIEYAMLPASEQSGWQDITIDLTLNSNWSGTVTQIRLQPAIDAADGDYFEFGLIEFIRY